MHYAHNAKRAGLDGVVCSPLEAGKVHETCGKDFLTVNVIPDTQKRTTMLHWRPGSRVNMETDLIGKYVRRIMQCQADGPATPQKSSGINKEFLLQNGFL